MVLVVLLLLVVRTHVGIGVGSVVLLVPVFLSVLEGKGVARVVKRDCEGWCLDVDEERGVKGRQGDWCLDVEGEM